MLVAPKSSHHRTMIYGKRQGKFRSACFERLEARTVLTTFVFNPLFTIPEATTEEETTGEETTGEETTGEEETEETFSWLFCEDQYSLVYDALQTAGDQLSSRLVDQEVVVTIDVDYINLAPFTLAGTTPNFQLVDYRDVKQALKDDETSLYDSITVDHLPEGPALDIYINRTADNPNGPGDLEPYVDDDGSANNVSIYTTTANAKALGITADGQSEYSQALEIDGLFETYTLTSDALIQFNCQEQWDFNQLDGIEPGAIDFVATAVHEIGHALGFLSGVDGLDDSNGSLSADELVDNTSEWYKTTFPAAVTVLDLFRYSTESLGDYDGDGEEEGSPIIDFTADAREKFFTFDQGNTRPGRFATGEMFGDGDQPSHWKDATPTINIMDPIGEPGDIDTLSSLDLQAFDVIGWDRVGIEENGVLPEVTVAHLSGTVFHDNNGNGTPDEGEGVGGHTIFYDADNNGIFGFGEQGIITNDSGYWMLVADLGDPPTFGTREDVVLRLALPSGTVSITGDPHEAVAIISGNPLTNHRDVHFGVQDNIDYSDAPHDLTAPVVYSYPTVGSDAASHGIVPNFHLGATVDGEPAGSPDTSANGDDLSGDDDDDGILFPAVEMLSGTDYTVTVTGSQAAQVGYFQMWIDFNRDGDWDDPNEKVLSDVRLDMGANELTFTIPEDSVDGTSYARGRLGFTKGLGPAGHDNGGEVEDYQIVLGPGGPGPLVLSSSGDLGSVDFLEVQHQQVSTATLLEMEAAHTGRFTVEATPANSNSDLELHVYNTQGVLLARSSSSATDQRVDIPVTVGDELLLWFCGEPNSVDLRITNLVAGGNTDLYVYGTDNDDSFTLTVDEGNEIKINGATYDFSSQQVSTITFYSGSGNDTLDAGNGWVPQQQQSIVGHALNVYHQGPTTLRVSQNMPTSLVQLTGDFSNDGVVDANDIDSLVEAIHFGSQLDTFDVNHDGHVNHSDLDFLVQDILQTTYGDSDLDQDVDIFDFNQLVIHFDPLATDKNWSEGNYDGDGDIDISDFQILVQNFSPLSTATTPRGSIGHLRVTGSPDRSHSPTPDPSGALHEHFLSVNTANTPSDMTTRSAASAFQSALVNITKTVASSARDSAFGSFRAASDNLPSSRLKTGELPLVGKESDDLSVLDNALLDNALLDNALEQNRYHQVLQHRFLDGDPGSSTAFGENTELEKVLDTKLIDKTFSLSG